jgi:hypothetical protein
MTHDFSLAASLDVVARVINLGDRRLDDRVVSMLADCLGSEESSIAKMFGGKDKLKAAQRLLSNESIDPLVLREISYACTCSRLKADGLTSVVCANDPTLVDFSRQDWKEGRMPIGDGNGMGYKWLNSVLVDPLSKRILGVAHQTLVSETGPDDQHVLEYAPGIKKKKARKKMLFNPANQFLTTAAAVDSRLPEDVEVTFAADREFDDGLVLRSLFELKRRHFVIRGNDSRVVQVKQASWLPDDVLLPPSSKELGPTPEGLVNVRVDDLARLLPCTHSQTLMLDRRGRVCTDPVKVERTAVLSIGGISIRLGRKSKRAERFKIPEEPVWLNLVVVREEDPPPNTDPIQWLLLTDLPISTPEELDRVITTYACRWRIEEFFRTTKNAIGLEKSELDDPRSTARLLFFTTQKAVFLDELRARAEIPAGVPPTREQRQELLAGAKKAEAIERARRDKGTPPPKLPRRERARMTMGLIAKYGRWTATANVSLGNYVLLGGLRIFLQYISDGLYTWLLEDAPS